MGTLRLLAVVGALALLAIPAGLAGGSSAGFSVVAEDLDNPRGLAFGPKGALFVVEARRGGTGPPCITPPAPPPTTHCYGPSGAVTRIWRGKQKRVVEGLPSLAPPATGFQAQAGPHDLSFDGKRGYLVTGLGGHPDIRATQLAPVGGLFGQLWRFWPGLRRKADIAKYEADVNPAGGPVDSNPYAVLATHGVQYVVDAGGNSLLRVHRGEITTVAVFPAQPKPPALPGPPFFESVPDSVVRGPGGDLFVGELTGFPFPVGAADVYRVSQNGSVSIYASGFTNIIDIAFDGKYLYVLEFDANSMLAPGSEGALWRVPLRGNRTKAESTKIEVPGLTLTSPAGLAVGHGAIYVSNKGTSAGDGEVVRISLGHHGGKDDD